MSENERQLQTNAVTINYKVQYVHIYDVVRFSINKIIKQGLLLSLLLKLFKSVNICHSYGQKGGLCVPLSSTFGSVVARRT